MVRQMKDDGDVSPSTLRVGVSLEDLTTYTIFHKILKKSKIFTKKIKN